MRIVISGYYGFGNVGDEAVLAAMLAALRPRIPSAEFTVLSADPEATQALHSVKAVARGSARTVAALAGADLFLSGGGGLIQDVTSARSALYYLTVLGLATVLSRRTMIFAQGIGPVRRRWIRALTRGVLDRVHVISVRDEDSQRVVQELGVRRPALVVADPVFALEPAPADQMRNLLGGSRRPRIGLAPRPWGGIDYRVPLIDAVKSLRDEIDAEVVVLAFHPQRDLALCDAIARALNGTLASGASPREMMALIGSLNLLVSVRLHALICAVAMGVAPVGLSYDPKVDGLFRRIGVGQLLPLQSLQAGPLRQALAAAWAARDSLRPRLLEQAAVLRAEALRAADLAAALLAPTPGR